MSAVIASEIRKILSTRMWWILLVCEIVLVAIFVASLGFALVFQPDAATGADGEPIQVDPLTLAKMVYTMGVSFGYVFPLILGTLAVTSEVRHHTLGTSILLEPRRSRLILGKFIAIIPFALLFGVAAVAAGVGAGALAFGLGDQPLMLDNPEVLRSLGMGVLALATWALVGVGFGTAVTNQVAAVVIVLAFTQLVEPILRLVVGFVEPLSGVAAFLPGAAGEAMVGASFYSAAVAGELLHPWAGFAVLLGYGVVAAVIGWLTTFRKDIT